MSSNTLWSAVLASALGGASAASAQPPAPPPEAQKDTVFFLSNAAPLPALGGQIDIVRGEGAVAGAVVKDKPYSARSITQSTQTLADGNRITQRNEARIYRDSQGRMRREQTLGGVGPWQASGQPVTMITINDPVANKSYVLDPEARTAREIRPFQFALARAESGLAVGSETATATWTQALPPPLPPPGAGEAVTMIRTEVGAGTNDVRVFARGMAIGALPLAAAAFGANQPGEDLGEQVLEGLLVHGERLTDTIPAGALGNDRPIEVVTERWYSRDIDALVRHRYFDPRFGETTYELVNVARGEPSPELFAVPQGYELKVDAGPPLGFGPPVGGVRVETDRVIVRPSQQARP